MYRLPRGSNVITTSTKRDPDVTQYSVGTCKAIGDNSSEKVIDLYTKLKNKTYDYPRKQLSVCENIFRSSLYIIYFILLAPLVGPLYIIAKALLFFVIIIGGRGIFALTHDCCKKDFKESKFDSTVYGFERIIDAGGIPSHRLATYRSISYIHFVVLQVWIFLPKYLSGLFKVPLITDEWILIWLHVASAGANLKFKWLYDDDNNIIGCEDDYSELVNDDTMKHFFPKYSQYYIKKIRVDYTDNNRITFELSNGMTVTKPNDSNDQTKISQYNTCKAHYQALISVYPALTHTWTHFGFNDEIIKWSEKHLLKAYKNKDKISVFLQIIDSHTFFTGAFNEAGFNVGYFAPQMDEFSYIEWILAPWKAIPISKKVFVTFAYRIVKNYYDINKNNRCSMEDLVEPDNVNGCLKLLISVLTGLYVICYIVLIGLVVYYLCVLGTQISPILLIMYVLITAIFAVTASWIYILMNKMILPQFVVIGGMISVIYCYWKYIFDNIGEYKDTIDTGSTKYSLIAIPSMILLIQVIQALCHKSSKKKKGIKDEVQWKVLPDTGDDSKDDSKYDTDISILESKQNKLNTIITDIDNFPRKIIRERSKVFNADNCDSKRGYSPYLDMLADYYDVIYTHWVLPLIDEAFVTIEEIQEMLYGMEVVMTGISNADPKHVFCNFIWLNLVHDCDHIIGKNIVRSHLIGNIQENEFDISKNWKHLLHGSNWFKSWNTQYWAFKSRIFWETFGGDQPISFGTIQDKIIDDNLYYKFKRTNLDEIQQNTINALHENYINKMRICSQKYNWLVNISDITSSIAY